MAKKIPLGKDELSKLGLKFIVANVPAFPVSIDKTYKMTTIEFHSKNEIFEKLSNIKNLIIFDEPAVYGTKFVKTIDGDNDIFTVRCIIDLTDKELSTIKSNINETFNRIYSFEWDFSCFE